MNGFDEYQVTSWVDECMTRHVVGPSSRSLTKRPRGSSLIVKAIVATAVVGALNVVAPETFASRERHGAIAADYSSLREELDVIIGSPEAYWSSLTSRIQKLTPLPEFSVDDVPMLI